ncbi:unnamed protein product [Mytilus edulis]|uniref:Phorbol-ester/DAG-type domain-containing protein n=1 Tax=Mytilus edulis TaxID=6550 RepID=A0A8S3UAC3_MYTED|nr:unnamed protein product [Mytilus edulis]
MMNIQPYKVDNIQKTNLVSVHALAQNSYNNNYTLNIEKSLKKKLESTKRSVIEYVYTGGGVTIKMDTISFELFIYALEQYFNDPSFKFHDYRKTIATDKGGNNVQYTYHIFDNPTDSYTINAYLTKCNLLINGKNVDKLFYRDIEHIHKIMSNTQINGANINTDLLNKNLASKLIEALDCLKKSATPNPGLPENKSTKSSNEERCIKCNRNCKSRAVLCHNNHWVHYKCDKLSVEDISSIEKNDKTYQCKSCDSTKVNILDTQRGNGGTYHNVPSVLKYHQSHITCTTSPETHLKTYGNSIQSEVRHITSARAILIEENLIQCSVCDEALNDTENICPECNLVCHNSCLDTNTNSCYTCAGLLDQRSSSNTLETVYKLHTSTNSILVQDIIDQSQDGHPLSTKSSNHSDCLNTQLPNLNTKDLSTSFSDLETVVQTTCKSIESNSHVAKSNHNNIELACTNTSAVPKTANPSIPDIPMPHNHHVTNSKETKQKLKKKEEQLKIKEAILNDKSNDKSSILDRLFKAESRNLELEQSLKTLNQCLDNSVKNQAHMDSKTTDNHKQKQPAEDLIRGIHERVTEYVLKKLIGNLVFSNPWIQIVLYKRNLHMAIVLQLAPSNTTLNMQIIAIVLQLVPSNTTLSMQIHIFRATHTTLTIPEITIFQPLIIIVHHIISGAMVGLTTTSLLIVMIRAIHTLTTGIIIRTISTRVTTRKQVLQIIIPKVTGGAMVGLTTTSPPETFHHSHNRHSAENHVCFSNLISLTPTQLSANSASNTEANCREKTSTARFHNSSSSSIKNTPEEKDKTSPMLHGSRIGQPLYYSQDKSEQDFLYKELFQFERHKMLS